MNRSLRWVVGFCGLVVAVSCGARDSSNGAEADASSSGPSYVPTTEQQVRAAYVSSRQAEGATDPVYAFHQTGSAMETVDPESQMRAKVDAEGLTLSKAGEPWSATLRTAGIGCHPSRSEGSPGDPSAVGLRMTANRVQIDKSVDSHPITEWYTHGPLGLEQGWALQESVCATGQLEIRLNVAGLAVKNGKMGVELRDESGHTKINYTDAWARDAKGRSLETTMSASGGAIAIHVDTRGATFPVEVDPLAWFQQQEITASDGAANDQFGRSVAVSGGTAVVGAYKKTVGTNARQGAAYVFVQNGATWTLQQTLTSSDGVADDAFGWSVAVAGGTAVVGACYKTVGTNNNQGAAYVFVRNGTTWTQQQRLTASDGLAGDIFGYSVAVSGGTAVVGALSKMVGANGGQGAAYAFVQNGTTWTEQQRLTAGDGAAQDYFGSSVAVSGSTAAVGAYGKTIGANINQGAAYVFAQNGTTWSQQQRLTASDGAAGDEFGSVAVSGGATVVGAAKKTVGTNANQGAAYVFVQNGSTWTEQQKLSASDGAAGNNFGFSVAVSGGTAVVGAHNKAIGTNSSQGAAYVFVQNGSTWTEQQRLSASDGAADDYFGYSVAVSGGTAVAGAFYKTVGLNLIQGTVYAFNLGPANGTPCTNASDCGSGFCADAFCCDTACKGVCQTCAAALKQTGKDDGICGPVLTGTNPHKDACPVDLPATCGHDGLCDGVGACRVHPPVGTICGTKCDANQQTNSTCDGNSTCTPGAPAPCGNYLCDATTKCKTSCSSKSDCSDGYACQSGKCAAGATCVGTDSQGADGKIIHCAPYQCDKTGACKVACASVDDCLAPASCNPSGQCVPPAASNSAGCSTSGGTGAASGFAMWLVVGVIARRRARLRAANRPDNPRLHRVKRWFD